MSRMLGYATDWFRSNLRVILQYSVMCQSANLMSLKIYYKLCLEPLSAQIPYESGTRNANIIALYHPWYTATTTTQVFPEIATYSSFYTARSSWCRRWNRSFLFQLERLFALEDVHFVFLYFWRTFKVMYFVPTIKVCWFIPKNNFLVINPAYQRAC